MTIPRDEVAAAVADRRAQLIPARPPGSAAAAIEQALERLTRRSGDRDSALTDTVRRLVAVRDTALRASRTATHGPHGS